MSYIGIIYLESCESHKIKPEINFMYVHHNILDEKNIQELS